ncbi:MAG: hypothetical protein ACOH17_11785 [Cellulomonas sp.]
MTSDRQVVADVQAGGAVPAETLLTLLTLLTRLTLLTLLTRR